LSPAVHGRETPELPADSQAAGYVSSITRLPAASQWRRLLERSPHGQPPGIQTE